VVPVGKAMFLGCEDAENPFGSRVVRDLLLLGSPRLDLVLYNEAVEVNSLQGKNRRQVGKRFYLTCTLIFKKNNVRKSLTDQSLSFFL